MFCLTCGRLGRDLCEACRASLNPAPDRVLDGGFLVRSAFRHEGAARDLVHHYKYGGSDRAGWILARALAPLIPDGAVIVPIPRASWRRLRYGIDPAPDLARRLLALVNCSIDMALEPPILSHRQAGRRRSERQPAALKLTHPPQSGAILLDDVVTTGRTLAAAHEVVKSRGIRVECAITATTRGD